MVSAVTRMPREKARRWKLVPCSSDGQKARWNRTDDDADRGNAGQTLLRLEVTRETDLPGRCKHRPGKSSISTRDGQPFGVKCRITYATLAGLGDGSMYW